MYHELAKRGLSIERQKPLPVFWDGIKLDIGFRADLIVEEKVILEIKSIQQITDVHTKQVLTYFKI
ncbi:GxxExxY protein [Flavobacterium shii]|uniref:GxxExxY protein n=1 Tax=Flavobacterium shii TaxID=2987687 RepID=UPI00299E4EBF|nr:GxxExxY protein [Flavobacterium shii]